MRIRIRDLVNPGSGMEKGRFRDPASGIRDKHPGSATLEFKIEAHPMKRSTA
jgi:hypothetical protein